MAAHMFLFPLQNALAACEFLLQNGANVNQADSNGNGCFDTENFAGRDSPVSLKITQKREASSRVYIYRIFIDGEVVYNQLNYTPTTMANVQAQFGPSARTTNNQAQAAGSYSNAKFMSK